jgi:hypothetical protein
MNIKEFAKLLNGRHYGDELILDEEKQAKELGFVIVFGASDDLMEFRGAIDDEVGCYNGGTAYLNETGVVEPCECDCMYYQIERDKAYKIKAIWNNEEIAWIYETEIPHEKFEIFQDDGEVYCVGIVFDINNLQGV